MAVTSQLGHFNLKEEIGRGGMGSVYRAFDPTLNREIAIKLLREDLSGNTKFVEDFLREARAAAAISHPHIVQIHSVEEEAGQLFIVMELLTGRTLREIIEKDGPLGEEAALDIAIDVAEALRAAYKNSQMIHGDIKPANIFVTRDQGAKVLDFGLAKLANIEAPSGEGIWGSAYYVSPERVGQKSEDFRSDVYSLGATLFHVLSGRPPFEAETPEELALKRLNERAPQLREMNCTVTQKTEQVVDKMLNKNILLRYRDYDAVIGDLQEAKTEATARRLGVTILRDRPAEPQPPRAPLKQSPKKSRSSKPLIAAVVLVGVAVLGAAGYFIWQQTQKQKQEPKPTVPPTVKITEPVKPPAPVPPVVVKPASTTPVTPSAPVVPPKPPGPTLEEQQKMVRDDEDMVRQAVSETAPLFPKYDFAGVLAVLKTTEAKLRTTEGKKAIQPHMLTAQYLVDLKAQFKADVSKLPYTAGDLQTHGGTALPGTVVRADDTALYVSSPYGETQAAWINIEPRSWLKLGLFYAKGLASTETSEATGRRLLQLAVFCKQYDMMNDAYAGARDAIRLRPTLKKDVDVIFGVLPPPPKSAPTPTPTKTTTPQTKPTPPKVQHLNSKPH